MTTTPGPSFEQWLHAIRTNPEAERMCWEALGYARGYCDAAGRGSGDAIDFARAFTMLVASGGSRPSIDGAWRNWLAGTDIAAFTTPADTP
ncbi:hypothetical protein [Nocardia transvalensis]|uniref:hypothetical protein n=1 Tax=Nocardia transvalensis TaxID=37333 RepID=UPI001893AA6D|nr:hypothetical protein [Nocardia transvalensis]MBF6328434.1 hypothetical protein [Nocardia transvalensis]